MTSIYDFYRKQGLLFFPLKDGTKEPAVSQGFKSSKEEIESKLKTMKDPNVAIISGKASGNLAVLDFENENDAWAFFDKETILKSTLCMKTCHNGVHVYFRTLDKCPTRQTQIARKFDLLGDGGYVVAPPSLIDHSLCERKKNGFDKCPHTNTKSTYYIISKMREIQLVTGLEESIKKKCVDLGWITRSEKSESQQPGSFEEIFQKAVEVDQELKALFEGREIPKTRSEAEYHLVRKLVRAGFNDEAICAIMSNSQIGKWQEKEDSYRKLTIEKARKSVLRSWLAYTESKQVKEEYPI
jgi:hypothetical protein